MPTHLLNQIKAAIVADQRAGHWPTISAWCNQALSAAANEARANNAGTLPTPPDRLPNRLER